MATKTQVHRYTGTQVHRYTGTQVHRYTGTQVHRYTGTQVHRYTGTQVHRYTGTQVHRYTGTPHHVLSCAFQLERLFAASQLVCECALCVVLCIPKEVVAQSILTKRVNVVNLESIADRKRDGQAAPARPVGSESVIA